MPQKSSLLQKQNEELARRINDEVRDNPTSTYAGKFVGIVSGNVAVVAENLNELDRELRQLAADPSVTFFFEARGDDDVVDEIWRVTR